MVGREVTRKILRLGRRSGDAAVECCKEIATKITHHVTSCLVVWKPLQLPVHKPVSQVSRTTWADIGVGAALATICFSRFGYCVRYPASQFAESAILIRGQVRSRRGNVAHQVARFRFP